jgi:hypothetical protein
MNATMETAELSYEESVGGPVSPPSSKKKKDVSLGVGTWPSPAQELVRDLMVRLFGDCTSWLVRYFTDVFSHLSIITYK